MAASEQEREQLQTALEDAEQRIGSLASENASLQTEKASLSSENARLRHLLVPERSRISWKSVPERESPRRSRHPVLEGEVTLLNEELQISIEELQVTAEELEEANAAFAGPTNTWKRRWPNGRPA